MKAKNLVFIAILAIAGAACNPDSSDFKMTVEKVDVLKGIILRGLALSGTVENGCIAKQDRYVVRREKQQLLETAARILKVEKSPGSEAGEGEAAKNDVVHLYIPDAKEDDVQPGDIVISQNTSCGEPQPEQ